MLFIWYERDGVAGTAGGIGAAYGPAAQIAAHAGAGCISSVAQGGKCGHGAAGAVTGVGTGMVMGHSWASAVIGGGLGSVAAGGSFEDGAVMGAMGFAFNCLAHGCLNRIFSSNPLIARNGDMGYAAVRGVANGLAEVQAGARLTIDVCGAFAAPCRGAGLALSVVDGGVALYNEDYWTLGGIVAGNIVGRGVANSLPVQSYPSDSFRQGVGHVYDQAVSRGIQAAPKSLGE